MDKILDMHARWRDNLVSKFLPQSNWGKTRVYIRHGASGIGPAYPANLHHPLSYHPSDSDFGPPKVGRIGEQADDSTMDHDEYNAEPLSKGHVGEHELEGRYITIHRDSPDSRGHVVLILNDHSGQHKITGGHPNYYGLRLSGVLPDEMYTTLAKHRHEQYHSEQAIKNMVANALAPQITASHEKDRPEARQLVKLPPDNSQAINISRTLRSKMTDREKQSEIDDLTNLGGPKREWLENFLKTHPDDISVVIVGEPRLRETLHHDLKAEHPSAIAQSDKPAVYVLGEMPPQTQTKVNVINYDRSLVDVPYNPYGSKSHHDILLDTLKERKRLSGSAGEFDDNE